MDISETYIPLDDFLKQYGKINHGKEFHYGCTGYNIKHSCVESLMGPLMPFIPLVTSFMLFFV